MGVQDILIHPTNSNIIYIATGNAPFYTTYGGSVYKSIDAGQSWQPVLDFNTGIPAVITNLKFHPNDPDKIYALMGHIGNTNGLLFISEDAGSTWANRTIPRLHNATLNFETLEFNPSNPNVFFISSKGHDSQILRSVNDGTTWTEVTPDVGLGLDPDDRIDRIRIATSDDAPNTLFAMFRTFRADPGISGNFIFRVWTAMSTNMGNTWNLPGGAAVYQASLSPNQSGPLDNIGIAMLEFKVSPVDQNVMYAGGISMLRSTNRGATWTIIPANRWAVNHDDIREIQIVDATVGGATDILFNGNDGGISRSDNGGIVGSWIDITGSGLHITTFFGIGTNEIDADNIIGGTQDNGTPFLMVLTGG